MRLLFVLIFISTLDSFSQSSADKRHRLFFIETGISANVPLTRNFTEINGTKSSIYQSFKSTNAITAGGYLSAGYDVRFNKALSLKPALSWYFLQEKKSQTGYESCPICEIPVPDFYGIKTVTNAYSFLSTSLSLEYHVRRVLFNNGIGISYLAKQKSVTDSYNFSTNSSTLTKSNQKYMYYTMYSSHKLGYEIVKELLTLYAGIYIIYHSYLRKSINSSISLQLKL